MLITATASERKVEMITASTPAKNSTCEKIVSRNRIIDMDVHHAGKAICY